MSRRKKDPEPPRSTAWENFQPDHPLYWKFGGPMIPVEAIPPSEYSYGSTATHLRPASRAKYLDDLIAKAQADYDESVAYYLALAEEGIDALKFEWHREEDRRANADPGRWVMVARNVDMHRASTYRSIRMRKNQLASYKAQLAGIEVVRDPLFGFIQP